MAMMNEKKSRFSRKLDHIFWFIVMMLPVFSWFLYLFTFSPASSSNLINLNKWLDSCFSFDSFTDQNIFYKVILNLFSVFRRGDTVYFSTFSTGLMKLLAYFASVEVFHVFFDVMVFIPRLCHKWVGKAVQDD